MKIRPLLSAPIDFKGLATKNSRIQVHTRAQVDIKGVKRWSAAEGHKERYENFLKTLKK